MFELRYFYKDVIIQVFSLIDSNCPIYLKDNFLRTLQFQACFIAIIEQMVFFINWLAQLGLLLWIKLLKRMLDKNIEKLRLDESDW